MATRSGLIPAAFAAAGISRSRSKGKQEMEINARNYHDPDIQLNELKLAVSRMPAGAALRPHFDFLFGYIAALQEEALDADSKVNDIHDLNATIGVAHSAIEKALTEHGETGPWAFEDAVTKLIEVAEKNAQPNTELMAVRL